MPTQPTHRQSVTSRTIRHEWRAVMALLLTLTLALTTANATQAATATTGRTARFAAGGETLTLDVLIPIRRTAAVRGPVKVVITLPAGMTGSVVSTDKGFNGFGYDIAFRNRSSADGPVVFSVTVPSTNSRTETEVDVAASSGYAVGVPGRTNVPTLVEIYV